MSIFQFIGGLLLIAGILCSLYVLCVFIHLMFCLSTVVGISATGLILLAAGINILEFDEPKSPDSDL